MNDKFGSEKLVVDDSRVARHARVEALLVYTIRRAQALLTGLPVLFYTGETSKK
jgi:hypothetical protein